MNSVLIPVDREMTNRGKKWRKGEGQGKNKTRQQKPPKNSLLVGAKFIFLVERGKQYDSLAYYFIKIAKKKIQKIKNQEKQGEKSR